MEDYNLKNAQEIFQKSLETIEYHKILDQLSKLCISEEAREFSLTLAPCLLYTSFLYRVIFVSGF